MTHSVLESAAIFLGTAVLLVPLSKRLGLGSVLGYLAGGLAIGPWGLKLIPSTEEILHFSEFGVVMLLFLVGLELNPKKLWALKTQILGTGGLQVITTMVLVAAIGYALGLPFPAAMLTGMAFSMSSTAIGLQTLKERGLLPTPAGQMSFSVLLFQDLAVIPMIAFLPLLGLSSSSADTPGQPWWIQILTIVGIIIGGRTALRPIFRFVGNSGLRETFTALSLFLVVGIAVAMQTVGLSAALGTFLAGVLLADSEYRHELEINIEPFKGLLLGLFFVSVGMALDVSVLAADPTLVVSLTLGIVLLKAVLLFGIGRRFKLIAEDSVIFGLGLSQIGEFAFVLIGLGATSGILQSPLARLLSGVVVLSMLTTPFVFMILDRWILPRLKHARPFESLAPENLSNPVIIAGFGRVGGLVARLLHSKKIMTTVIDHDPNQIELVKKFGWKAYYGDITRLDLLESAGIADAKLFILAIDDMEAAVATADLVRKHFPKLKIIARARNRQYAYEFVKRGIPMIRETFDSSLEMGELALREMGMGSHAAHRLGRRFKEYDTDLLQEQIKHADNEKKLISMANQGRADLEKLMLTDQKRFQDEKPDAWG